MNRLSAPELDSRPIPATLENLGSIKFGDAEVIMGKLGNATARAELGRATWHLVHTMAARFPEYPTQQQQQSLLQFFHLLSTLYPCGDCAEEFQKLLKQNPPQVSSREAASQWACGIHNLVNKRLRKPQFDCSTVAERWKCGCTDE
ncbi:hypothetical protein K493DRAFT_204830 [Basidiobolus meristosporus CBS 931.73]|uniref:Sulfhydryl oxidase n=1 Tax=Basidiobolus meristosporus CBS 931.73 TaxID=1314790 RepID=A0A1Y1Z5X6_9FUNG|nr:hypothetical protein K493DRAFT_204830 [Basidiobolus meristosporus CBS 931.73]|eukprot:ORY05205.1 hypothetical protein K493DRAFT_204830 [Basidiobolus meristosporus CBS 931.73]